MFNIPLCLDNPKIGRVYNAEVVGDRIAEDGPVFLHLHAQEMQNGSAELIVGRVARMWEGTLAHFMGTSSAPRSRAGDIA